MTMVKGFVTALLMSGAIATLAGATKASQQVVEQDGPRDLHEQVSIVGSWMGTLDNGERLLMSFTSDGIALSSVQAEVKLIGPVLTPAHGAWEQVGRRQFAFTSFGVLYDIQTGAYQGSGKIRALVTIDRRGNLMTGTATVDIFDPDGNLIATFPHALNFTRIKVEPLDSIARHNPFVSHLASGAVHS